MKLEGKVAIITGSSRGIGACIARRYGAEGARVAVVAHSNLDKAEAVVKEINDAGGEAKAFQADVAQVFECDRLAGEVTREVTRRRRNAFTSCFDWRRPSFDSGRSWSSPDQSARRPAFACRTTAILVVDGMARACATRSRSWP